MMKTSRVQSSTSAMYRNQKLYVQVDGAFQDVYSQSGQQQNKHSLLHDKKKGKQQQKKRIQLSTIKTRMIMKGMQMSAESTHIHNHLIRRANIANSVNFMRTRNQTYRTSI